MNYLLALINWSQPVYHAKTGADRWQIGSSLKAHCGFMSLGYVKGNFWIEYKLKFPAVKVMLNLL